MIRKNWNQTQRRGDAIAQCVLVMESSEDRIGAHDVGFSAAMARSRSGNRDCRGIGSPRTQPHMGPSAIVMLDPRTKGCPQSGCLIRRLYRPVVNEDSRCRCARLGPSRGEGEACGRRLITRASPVKAGRYRDELASTTELGSYGGDLSTDRRALKLLHRLGKGTCSNGDADLGLHMPLDMRLG